MTRALIHDISNWQGDLSRYWPLFKEKGCRAVIIKATEGLAFYGYWKDTARAVKEHGFLLGSYHYYRQHIQNAEGHRVACSPTRQAENHYNWLQKCGVHPDLPPALDVEPANNLEGISSAGVEACLNHLEKLFGRTPILYSNPSTLVGIAQPHWSKFPLWLAHYTSEEKVTTPKPWTRWLIWQFSDKITYTPPKSTARKPIDHNWFNGTEEELIRFAKGSPAEKDALQCEPGEGLPKPNISEPSNTFHRDITVLKERINNLENWAAGFKL